MNKKKIKTKCEKCETNDSSHFFLKKEICGDCYDKITKAINSLKR